MQFSASVLLALASVVAALPASDRSDVSKVVPAAKLFEREACGYGWRACSL